MTSQGCRGFTLIELLTTLTIAATLTTLCIGGLGSVRERSQRSTALQKMVTTLDRARSLAAIRGKRVAVCSLDNTGVCVNDWTGNDLTVFLDANQSRQYDLGDEIIYRQPWDIPNIHLSWNRPEPAIIYQPDGSVVFNGTLQLLDKQDQLIQSIILSKPGRMRIK